MMLGISMVISHVATFAGQKVLFFLVDLEMCELTQDLSEQEDEMNRVDL
jgi:hypothetical protein